VPLLGYSMKRLYLGNTTTDTDHMVSVLAHDHNTVNRGLIHSADQIVEDGFYHTTIVDISEHELKLVSCEVVLLDQPKESYNTVTEYNQTLQVFDKNTYWSKLVQENKSFCIFPFINHSMNLDDTTLCCRSRTSIGKTADIDWHAGCEMREVRQNMLAGKRLKACDGCYTQEQSGRISDRQAQTVDWANRLDLTSVAELDYDKPVMYDVFPNNNCNLMCRMCIPEYSVLIQREQGIQDKPTPTNWDSIDIATAHVVYIAGGEPTAMIEFPKFLDRCRQNNRTDLEIRINTNAAKISDRVLQQLADFDNIHFTVSIDGYKQANNYQRWLSNWDNIIDNTNKIIQQGHSVNFNVTLSLYTIFEFSDLVHYIDKHYPNHSVNAGYAYSGGDVLSPFVFKYSKSLLDQLCSITNTNVYHNNAKFKQFVDHVITSAELSTHDTSRLQQFFAYNDLLDLKRNSVLRDYIPQLEELRGDCKI
jgi:sulfatase maturation enzyme AslB (radical SAM superfamily)